MTKPSAPPSPVRPFRGRDTADTADPGEARGVPRRRLFLGALATIVFLAFGIWLIAFSSVFGVGKVIVKGTHVLTADAVRRAAHVTSGAPLIRLDTSAIEKRVEALPDVASARVSISYPSSVVITVHERVPVGFVVDGAAYRLVDRTGYQYRVVDRVPHALPKFVLPSGGSARATGAAVATMAGALPATLLQHVSSVQALNPTAITLVLDDGRIVRWGSGDRSAEKALILPVLLRHRGQQFDVTNPDQPFVRD